MKFLALCLLAAAIWSCQGSSSPTGPAAKSAAVQADTSGCVVINITGDHVTVSGAQTANLDLPDTVWVDSSTTSSTGSSPAGGGFRWLEINVNLSTMSWITARDGWAYYDTTNISSAQIDGVYLRKIEGFSTLGSGPVEWTEFYQFLSDEGITGDDAPTYTVLDALGEFFIHDEDEELEPQFLPSRVTYVVGLLLTD